MQLIGAYLAWLGTAVALLAAAVAVYVMVTPHHEIRLIRKGNAAAAWSLGGTLVGLSLPLASALANAVSLPDLALWGAVALVTQLLGFLLVALVMRDLRAGIEADRLSYGIMVAAVAVALGVLNAGALTY